MKWEEASELLLSGKKLRYSELQDYFICYRRGILCINGQLSRKVADANIMVNFPKISDWEIVDDDKDWNLNDNDSNALYAKYSLITNVIKCRDLILNDLEMRNLDSWHIIKIVVNKRFGNLE